jgi:type III pantothenate kinase
MHHYTDVLPLISIDQIADVDAETSAHPPLGRNTEAAMMSGVFWGQVGAIRELIQRIGEPLAEPFDIVLTGGGSRLLAPQFPDAIHCPYLPLQGLIVAAASTDAG